VGEGVEGEEKGPGTGVGDGVFTGAGVPGSGVETTVTALEKSSAGAEAGT